MQSQNVDILRICIKMIVLMVKHQSIELFSRDPPKYDASIPNSVQIELEREKDRNRGLFLEVIENMHSVELTSPFLGESHFTVDFAYQMSLLSNLIYSEIKSGKNLNLTPMSNVQIRLLPSVASLVDLIIQGSKQMSTLKFDREKPEECKSQVYRYFFFNFTISAALPDILGLVRNDSHQHKVLHHEIFKALTNMLNELHDKTFNDIIDEEIIQENIKVQDQLQIIQANPDIIEIAHASLIGV